MVKFKLSFGKWFKISGDKLTGNDLGVTLSFVAFVILVVILVFKAIDLPKVQVLF